MRHSGLVYHKFGNMVSPDSLLIHEVGRFQVSSSLAVFGTRGGELLLHLCSLYCSVWKDPGRGWANVVIGGVDSAVILSYVLPFRGYETSCRGEADSLWGK